MGSANDSPFGTEYDEARQRDRFSGGLDRKGLHDERSQDSPRLY